MWPVTMHNIEDGLSDPTAPVIGRILKVFGKSFEEVFIADDDQAATLEPATEGGR